MKHCPRCDFTFADFYNVCEFDGTELVDDPERPPSSVKASPSRFRRVLKSPVFFTALLVVAVLASALMIGYYDSVNQSNSIAGNQPAQNSSVSPVLPAQTSVQPPAQDRTRASSTSRSEINKPKAAKDLSSTRDQSVTASRSRARLHSSRSIRNQQRRPEIARQRKPKDKALQKESKESALQRDSKKNANRKESKLTATLKTTWNILKRPFKF